MVRVCASSSTDVSQELIPSDFQSGLLVLGLTIPYDCVIDQPHPNSIGIISTHAELSTFALRLHTHRYLQSLKEIKY
jgi:hypothetical protein